MFAKVVVILALAFVAAAYQGLEVPDVYKTTQYGIYHPFKELFKSVVGYPYYKYPYYNIEGKQEYVTPDVGYFGAYPINYQHSSYYPQYASNWLKYPYYGKYYTPVNYDQTIPYSYASYPLWGKTFGGYGYGSKYYTGVPEYLA